MEVVAYNGVRPVPTSMRSQTSFFFRLQHILPTVLHLSLIGTIMPNGRRRSGIGFRRNPSLDRMGPSMMVYWRIVKTTARQCTHLLFPLPIFSSCHRSVLFLCRLSNELLVGLTIKGLYSAVWSSSTERLLTTHTWTRPTKLPKLQ